MYDFLKINVKETKTNVIIEPKFTISQSSDLMIRGRDFYAIWDEEKGFWSLDEHDVVKGVDKALATYFQEHRSEFELPVIVKYMWDSDSGSIDKWHKYCQKQRRDSWHQLDEKIIFSNMSSGKKEDYATHKLPYPLAKGDHSAWDKLVSTLYSEEERHKIEWCIGAIVSGDSKKIQKFAVFYGSGGTGKGTILSIVHKMFDGYCATFDAKKLGSSKEAFALEEFKTNPLIAIQFDGDLSKIEDNTRINSLVAHEEMTVNEKFKAAYSMKFNAFLMMGSNKPVRITDAKSGIIRRLIDISPTGNLIPPEEYDRLMAQIDFELGAIAEHCLQVYNENPKYYNHYIPTQMLEATNDFFGFIEDSYIVFKAQNGTTMKAAWEMYKKYCDDAKVPYPYPQRTFKLELKNYFEEVKERYTLPDGTRVRNYYFGFIEDKFKTVTESKEPVKTSWIDLKEQHSLFDDFLAECSAQYPKEDGRMPKTWANCDTKTKDIDTSKVHHIRTQDKFPNLITIDFDLKDEQGNKSLEKNLEAASKWPKTYCELSKGGSGLHLEYIYTGDPTLLSRVYDDEIEVKVPVGDSSLRRKLTLCNDIPIAEISSGLPLKEKKVINQQTINNEKHLRRLIKKALYKEIEPGATVTCVNFIDHILEEAYGKPSFVYDVSDLYDPVLYFASHSTHHAKECIAKVAKMHFTSETEIDNVDSDAPIVIFDVEVFPNLFLVCWKIVKQDVIHVMFNPSPAEIETLFKYRLVGFNNRKYDNHMLYACHLGYSVHQIYELSNRIINGDKDDNPFFREAYNLSYTDIYDFSSKKQSLKKFEIELGIHHQELGLPWDQPVPEELWETVADYCKNDVAATEAVFYSKDRQADFTARLILAEIAGMTPNDTTNQLTTRFIFGKEKHPQSQFNYRNMGEPDWSKGEPYSPIEKEIFWNIYFDEYTVFNADGTPIFPGYEYKMIKEIMKSGKEKFRMASIYRDEEAGEGGYVYSEPNMYWEVALLDIASMHPSSIIAEWLFGEYTARFQEILDTRILIKHKEFDKAKKMLNGALAHYLKDESSAKALAQALKIAINSVYGLTSAKFDNPFRDPRNEDNIVAKRGALFMINLKHEVQKRGFTVAHIKTDSIKIPNATPEIIKFVQDYGKMYGYSFEHEATYERMCLVNKSTYIAKYATAEDCQSMYGYIPGDNRDHPGEWTATGDQFQVPYVFKTLFSKEPVTFDDMTVTDSVQSAIYIATGPEDNLNYRFVGKVGCFIPIKPGYCGGLLLREAKDKDGNIKYDSVNGAKGYFWEEAEVIKGEHEDWVDKTYFNKLVDEAVETISQYGDFEAFVA